MCLCTGKAIKRPLKVNNDGSVISRKVMNGTGNDGERR